MKKWAIFLSAVSVAASSSVLAAGTNQGMKGPSQGQPGAVLTPDSSCNALTSDEQNFAGQILDKNNQLIFCTQFTPQQRQMAMQMLGKPDSAGNKISADGAVLQVIQTSGITPPAAPSRARTPGGACPVK